MNGGFPRQQTFLLIWGDFDAYYSVSGGPVRGGVGGNDFCHFQVFLVIKIVHIPDAVFLFLLGGGLTEPQGSSSAEVAQRSTK